MRLFHQPEPGDWESLVQQVADELQSRSLITPQVPERAAVET